VCAVVIFLCVAFMVAYVPEEVPLVVSLMFICFMVLNFVTLALAFLMEKQTATSSEKMLGSAMLFIAAYFLLSVLIMPQFAALEEVYRLSCHAVEGSGSLTMEKQLTFFLLTTVFASGIAMTMRKRSPLKP
jgi:predicted transporter